MKKLYAVKDDPEALKAELVAIAESFVPKELKAGYDIAKGLVMDPRTAIIQKAIDPLWVKYDPENKGFITKD